MSKRIIRVLSMVLTLVMMLSLSTPAFAWGGIDTGKGWDRQIGEDDFREIEPAEEVEEEEVFDYFQTDGEDGYQVTVEAPMGSLPMLAELRAEPVEIEEVREAVESVIGGEANILVAMDISFFMNGIEIEPEEPVNVKISAPELTGKSNLTVVHIPDEDEPETVDLIDEEDLSFALGTNEIAFRADSFSTYVITWDGDESATVHWGTMNGETFEEFDSSKIVTLDTTAATISLDVDFEGYAYNGAFYVAKDSTEQIVISPILKKTDGKWQVEAHIADSASEVELVWADLADSADIYVIYTVPQSQPSHGADLDDVPSPETKKNVLENEDGTRTIVLDVTGSKVVEDKSYGANVLILLDRTSSMSNMMTYTKDRMDVAKDAIDTLVSALTTGDNAGNDVQFALLDFYVRIQYSGWGYNYSNADRLHSWNPDNGTHQNSGTNYWNSYGAAFNNYIQDDSYSYPNEDTATNWESPLVNARTILNSRDNDTTYVIFVTDGEPNCRGTNSISTSYINYYNQQAATALVNMSTAQKPIKFYGVFCGNSSGYNTLNNMVKNSGGVETIDGSSEEAMTDAFGKIAQTIIDDLFANDVSVDDGVPSLSSVSSGVVEGGAGGYEYFRLYPLTASGSNYTYKIGETSTTVTAAQVAAGKDENGYAIEEIPEDSGNYYIEIPWTEGYPGASYNQANGVTWDLSTVSVQPGVTYRLKFKVWPSQEAYDTIADLNNGLITMTPEELDAAGIGGNKEEGYYLLTNTHLKTTYSFNGTTYEDEPEELPKDEMKLPTTTISVKKLWNNDLDAREASGVTLTVTKDGNAYKDVVMGDPAEVEGSGGTQWVQTPTDQIYISMGQLTLDSEDNIEVISSGHEYTVIEPEDFSYNWELTADIYHPMVVNGTATVLIEVPEDQKAELPADVSGLAQNKHLEKEGTHYYAFNGNLYVAQSGDNVLSATNDRRSNLNLTKTVEAADGIQIPEDALFTYTAKISYPEGINDDVWFSIQDENGSYILNGHYDVNDYVTGATQEADKTMDDSYKNIVFHKADDIHHYDYYTYTRYDVEQHSPAADDGTTNKIHTGFYYVPDATAFTLKIRAGWNVRFTNMPNDTQYEFNETAQPDGFVFKSVEAKADNGGADGTVAEKIVSGTIDKPNNVYTVTYTNTCLGYFYVYHSADNTIERYPMAENGKEIYVDGKTFDIAHLTKDGSLYGGYYKDYSGKTAGFDAKAAAALEYTDDKSKDETGTAYAGGPGIWVWNDAYKVNGFEMVPTSNTVYYLKEVPETKYLRPYLHYTYKLGTGEITSSWMISDVDDANYNKTGFIVTNTNDKEDPAKVVKSLTVTNENNGNSVKLTPNIVFGADGYLTYTKVMENCTALTSTTGFAAGCKVQEFWVTRDGILVTGITERTYAKIQNHNSINNAATDVDVGSSMSVYTEPASSNP